MELSKLEDLKVACKRRRQEIKNDRSEVIEFLRHVIVEFRNYLDPNSIGMRPGTITYELIDKYLKRYKNDLVYDFNFPLNLREHYEPLKLNVFIESISKNNPQSNFSFLIDGESLSLPLKNSDALHEYIKAFDCIYESFKEQINKSCNL